ncbi:Dabb family protein [Brucella pituitosa]|uniref:Dabb family protein n=1 Tax=Brucella pituitosa TaxID=571256 RepID=A0ABS3JUQ4_9HYPH|nr:Dabb family protein [Brucella pituitosa]MBO1038409.1 Dabb family protein [Brucella pituitosa]
MIRHIVLIRFRSDIGSDDIADVLNQVVALREKIEGIVAVSTGGNVSPEALEKGFRHGFVVDFADAAARDAYLPHPDHVVVGTRLVELAENGIEGILVFDYNF